MTNALKSLGPPTTSDPAVGFYAGQHRLGDTDVVVQPRGTWFVPCQVSRLEEGPQLDVWRCLLGPLRPARSASCSCALLLHPSSTCVQYNEHQCHVTLVKERAVGVADLAKLAGYHRRGRGRFGSLAWLGVAGWQGKVGRG